MRKYTVTATARQTKNAPHRYVIDFDSVVIPLIVLDVSEEFFIQIAQHIERSFGFPKEIDFQHFIATFEEKTDQTYRISISFPITFSVVQP